jgi:adhesin/invasin
MKAQNYFAAPAAFFVSALLLAVIIAGCSSSSNDSSDNASLQVATVTATPSSISVGSTTVVEAVVTDGSKPLANRVVAFTASPASSGYFTPALDTSDADGIVASVFTATQSGTASLTATVSGVASKSVSVSVVSSSQQGSGNIDLVVSPTLILADGISTSQVTVTVYTDDNQPAPDSTIVRLAAGEKFDDIDGNGYFTSGVDSVIYDAIPNGNWDPIGIIPSTAATSSGQATVIYIAGTEAVTVYIKATVDDSVTGNAETSIQLTPDASIASISLMTDNAHMMVKSTGGIETGKVYATGYDANGNPVPEGLQISFIITDGPGGGEHLGAVGYGPFVGTTNGQGIAVCPLASGTVSGTVRIRAYSDTVLSNATQIMIHAGPPYEIKVGAEVCNAPYWGWLNKRVQITAVVSDIYHNPVADSTVVYFTCDEGTIKAHEGRTQDEEGVATSWWISGYDDTTADGIVEIYAETAGGAVRDTGYFLNSWVPDTLWFVGFPGSINADGKSTKVFWVEVRDLNGLYVNDQTEIDIESYFLNVASGVVQDGCNASIVRTFMTSIILDYDYSLTGATDNGIGAIDLISANYKGFVNTIMPCTLLTGPAYYNGCILDIAQTVNYGTTVPISVTIKDRWGNPLGDHLLTASVSGGGSISGASQRSNMYGEASGFTFTAPTDTTIESVIIQVRDYDPRGNITLTKSVSLSK